MPGKRNNQLGRTLQELREQKNWSQEFVARRIGIPRASYRDIEHTSVSKHLAEVLPKLSRLYRKSIEELFGNECPKSIIKDCRDIQGIAEQIVGKVLN